MADVIDFEAAKTEKEETNEVRNLTRDNFQYFTNITEKIRLETTQLMRLNSPVQAAMASDVNSILMHMLGLASIRVKNDRGDGADVKMVMEQYRIYIDTLLNGGILSPISGDESEWAPVDELPPEKEVKIEFRGKLHTIPIESIDVNVRCPQVYRFNHDNRFAHRVDFYRFVDIHNPKNVMANKYSRRFISFPYTLESHQINVVYDEETNQITKYCGISEIELMDRLVFPQNLGGCFIASPIPLFMLELDGVNIQQEIEDFKNGNYGRDNSAPTPVED